MEENTITAAPVTTTTTTTINNDLAIVVSVPLAANGEDVSINGGKNSKKKRRSGGFSFLRAASLIFRPKPNEKPKPPAIQLDVASKATTDNWKKIVGSIRPLHLQDHPSQSPPPLTVNTTTVNDDDDDENQPAVENFEDVIPAPVSPTLSSSESTSVYGSAMNLQELDKGDDDDEEDEDQVFDNKPADELIDAKAEEFIAHFYAQMRRQQLDSACHNHRRNTKSF